jgi:hypothetical protein
MYKYENVNNFDLSWAIYAIGYFMYLFTKSVYFLNEGASSLLRSTLKTENTVQFQYVQLFGIEYLYLIYLYTPTLPDEPMNPRSEIHSRTYHTKIGIVRGKVDNTSDKNNPRYAQAETGLNYTYLSYKLIQTYIQTSHDESKEIGKCFHQIKVLMMPKLQK